ncbi:NACHT, LRR and PYD domains-containing protein 6 [Holothuria leucospilota]|uniref:Netrin receptor UNC5 n=1 Tax=Holothuria leucospilota TaxID=206669 RepID=A0A9Q1BBH5_HOLLE|nr:NACHT, LRR and PYD domains-containing protein 6 [Holothuria leucospilota]
MSIKKFWKKRISSHCKQPLTAWKDKRALFVEFLKKKIKSWYETMTPVPWKKSCQWKSTDLFVGSGLILTDSKAKQNVQNVDEQCKLNYTEIFTHDKLKSEIRIILEGDPGAGKTMLLSQLAYDWSKGKIDGVDILVFLPLKIVEDKTLIQAIEQFYIPTNSPLLENDIESILASDKERICLLLDGLEEYSTGGRMKAKESSEVMKIMKKEKHSNCKVVVTSRSDFANDLPECPLLKLGRFGETERNSYVEKLLPEDTNQQQKIKRIIQDNPFILDLCSVPLLFVLAVHNIESMSLSEEGQLSKVSPFMRSMILTLCSSSTVKHEVDGIRSKFFRSEKMTLGELAFNGLCKGHQQLSWQKDFMERNAGSLKPWVDSGILVLEEGLVISEKEDQDISERNKGVIKKVKTKKKKKKETKKGTQKQEAKGKGKKEKSPGGDSSEKPKKKRKEKEADESEIVPDKMLTEEFLGPSTSHDIPQIPILSENVDMVSASMVASQAGHEVSEIEEQHQSVSASQVPLVVKFLHKVIQEWFAATFFCSMMRRCTSEEQFQNYVSSQLQHISPTDLHYVLRFSSYLHPPSCHVIIKCLLRNYLKDGCVPPYIMNCVFLCFNEHNDVKGPDMRNAVIDVCKEVITIQSEDSRLLQQAKCALLAYGSNDGVIIENLELKDVIFAVDKTSLTLNSGVQLAILHTVKVIKVSRWDQVLQEEDYKNILKLLSAGTLLKEVCCIFPSPPPDTLDEITLGNIVSKDLKVEWHIGHFVQYLDPRKGKWMMDFKQSGTSSTEIKEVSADQGSAKNKEEMQRPTTSSLPRTSAEFTRYSHNQETLKRIGSDSFTGFAVPEKKAKVVLEEPAVSDIAQGVHQTGTVSSGEGNDDLKEIPVRNIEERNFEEEAAASGDGQRTLTEEISITGVVQAGIRQVFREVASVNRVTPMSFPGETLSDTTQRNVCGGASVQRAVQEYAPVLDDESSHFMDSYTSRKIITTKDGGTLEISNTSIMLVVPPNALPADKEEHEIHMRYIPRRSVEDQVKCFSSNSTAVVEILPNLSLQHPVRLSLPHCLVLQQNLERKAKIFASHHEKGTHPVWKEQKDASFHVEDTTCIIFLNSFSWYKYGIDDEIVIAKKIVVYAAAQKPKPYDDLVRIEVGCYPDLPGQEEDISGGQNLIVAHKKILYFVKSEKQHPLQISLHDIFPSGWQCRRSGKLTDTLSKKISYSKISEDLGDSCVFILEKSRNAAGMPLCVFTASQEKDVEMDNVAVQLAVNFQVIEKVPPNTGEIGHQCKSSLKAETTVTKSGVEFEIPDTGVVLKIPPDALEGNGENHLVGIRIIPSRIMEDQGTSLSSNSCTAVEVYPHTISLRHPIELRLPHCLTFKENSDLSARIFTMHLNESTPKWEIDTNLQYKLDEKACMIKLNRLCCVQYVIDNNIVKGKKIRVYTAAKELEKMDEVAELEVGFYPDTPGGGELLRMNPNFTVDSKKKLLFMEKRKSPLQLSLDDIAPSLWECWFPKAKPQDIPVEAIAGSIEHSNLFILKKTSNELGSAICTFTTLPKEGPMSLEMALTVCPKEGRHEGIVQSLQMKPSTDSMTATFQLLAKKLTDEWKHLGRKLCLDDADIFRIERDYKRTEETIYQMLQCWKKKEGSSASYAVLVTALVEVGRRDLAEKVQHLKDVFEEA